MPTDFTLPELGENIAAGDVVRVLVSPGDVVKKDQPLLELETDKATIEVPSTVSGTVKDIKVKQGEKVKVGQVVLTVDDAEAAGAAAPASAPKEAKSEKPKPQPVGAPEEGGLSQRTPEAASAETGKREQPAAEPPAEPRPKRGEVVDIRGAARSAPAPQPQAESETGPPPPAAPSVRRLARELGVDIHRVPGSGPEGRISIEDVQAFVRAALAGGGGAAPAGAVPAGAALPDFA